MTIEQYLRDYANEEAFTVATNRFINANYPAIRHFYFHVPNESATNPLRRIILFNMGVLAGVPDFCFILPQLWFMELKIQNGMLTKKQKALHELWKSKGIEVMVCNSAQSVLKTLIEKYGNPIT